MKLFLCVFWTLTISLGNNLTASSLSSFDHFEFTSDSIPKKNKQSFLSRKSPIVGTSLTYIPGEYYSYRLGQITEHEITWSLNMTFPISKRWDIGVNYMAIFRIDEDRGKSNNWLAGVFEHYNFFSSPVGRIYAEAGLYAGNICFCNPNYYTSETQLYFSMGGGGEIRLSKHFSVDAALIAFAAFQNITAESEVAPFYILGINYQF